MTKIILTFVFFLMSLYSFSQETIKETSTKKITVTLTNASSDTGKIHFSIYKKAGFSKREPILREEAKIVDGKSTIEFSIEEEGTYAILCYHDSNSNGRMDFAVNGMPLEDYGASNNVMGFGPPSFDDSKFELTKDDLEFSIKF